MIISRDWSKTFWASMALPLWILLQSCSHSPAPISSEQETQIREKTPLQIDLTQSESEIRKEIERVQKILNQRTFSESDMVAIERIYAIYRSASALAQGQKIWLAPHSRTRIRLESFCLDPANYAPAPNEHFDWKKGDPGIPVYAKIIEAASTAPEDQQPLFQELVWNLANKTFYEDYPPELKTLLNSLDPNARFHIPSRTTEKIKDLILENLPDPVGSKSEIIRGQYYRYEEITSSLRQNQAAPVRNGRTSLSRIPGDPSLFSSSENITFSQQDIAFFNPHGLPAILDLSQFLLSPTRSGVQRLGVYANTTRYKKIAQLIDEGLRDAVFRNAKYWYQGRLTPKELELIHQHSGEAANVYIQAARAEYSTIIQFGHSRYDDESDAFRHFVWAGLLTQQLGEEKAREYLDAHEQFIGAFSEDEMKSSQMDRYNNEKGIESAKTLEQKDMLNLKNLEESGLDYLKSGKLRVINPRSH